MLLQDWIKYAYHAVVLLLLNKISHLRSTDTTSGKYDLVTFSRQMATMLRKLP